MQTLFDRTLADQLQARTAGLAGNPPALWGTMTAAQAAAHCADALAIASGDRHSPRVFLGHLLGWVIKPMAVGIDSPNTSTITCGSLARERSSGSRGLGGSRGSVTAVTASQR